MFEDARDNRFVEFESREGLAAIQHQRAQIVRCHRDSASKQMQVIPPLQTLLRRADRQYKREARKHWYDGFSERAGTPAWQPRER
jgi:hypothetical protein